MGRREEEDLLAAELIRFVDERIPDADYAFVCVFPDDKEPLVVTSLADNEVLAELLRLVADRALAAVRTRAAPDPS